MGLVLFPISFLLLMCLLLWNIPPWISAASRSSRFPLQLLLLLISGAPWRCIWEEAQSDVHGPSSPGFRFSGQEAVVSHAFSSWTSLLQDDDTKLVSIPWMDNRRLPRPHLSTLTSFSLEGSSWKPVSPQPHCSAVASGMQIP
ncbi:uncharacterized protein LOC118153048 [Callithrix jacchus]